MPTAHIHRIGTAVPPHDIHDAFVGFAGSLLEDDHARAVFARLAAKAQVARRFSVLAPAADAEAASVDAGGVYTRGAFPTTAERMELYEQHAPPLALRAVEQLELGSTARELTHLIVTSCTGMQAPGIDFELIERCGLNPSIERTLVGFMGCYAAINGLKLAHHIVRSEPDSKVLMVNLELCSLHLQQTTSLESMLSYLLFADGCAASLISAEPFGLAIDGFHAASVPDTRGLITWNVRDSGFDMHLSGEVPRFIERGVAGAAPAILDGAAPESIALWAVHPGGRSVLDAVERGLRLGPDALATSREVLNRFGNMSSAAVMFVLRAMLAATHGGERGCALAFGPGLVAETMRFHRVPT